MWNIIAVFIGGGLGSLTRFGISRLVTSSYTSINPVATLISNVVSTAILGLVLVVLSQRMELPEFVKSFLVVGFCGGFSTFSTFSYEIFQLMKTGSVLWAGANLVASLLLGVGILFIVSKLFFE